jgi:hypothetical protein
MFAINDCRISSSHLVTWRLTAWQLWKYEYGLHLIRTYVTNRIKPCAAAWRLFASISTDFQSRHVHVMFYLDVGSDRLQLRGVHRHSILWSEPQTVRLEIISLMILII